MQAIHCSLAGVAPVNCGKSWPERVLEPTRDWLFNDGVIIRARLASAETSVFVGSVKLNDLRRQTRILVDVESFTGACY